MHVWTKDMEIVSHLKFSKILAALIWLIEKKIRSMLEKRVKTYLQIFIDDEDKKKPESIRALQGHFDSNLDSCTCSHAKFEKRERSVSVQSWSLKKRRLNKNLEELHKTGGFEQNKGRKVVHISLVSLQDRKPDPKHKSRRYQPRHHHRLFVIDLDSTIE